ncbi:hypothetical protein LWI28_004967 [Acer negundo]|uniref:Uncharacterized protein n=1 Tax=Acer negundo TaxID=4023 RepID=A0AAD5IC66_ACENE|nr:hypothetical protein LWI28_004967 [Acer negundo]
MCGATVQDITQARQVALVSYKLFGKRHRIPWGSRNSSKGKQSVMPRCIGKKGCTTKQTMPVKHFHNNCLLWHDEYNHSQVII